MNYNIISNIKNEHHDANEYTYFIVYNPIIDR